MTARTFRYLTPATQEALDGLVLSPRGPVEGRIAGLHRSRHRGASVEFAEYREYVRATRCGTSTSACSRAPTAA